MYVSLRPPRITDRDLILAWRNSDPVAPFMVDSAPISADVHARWFAGLDRDDRRVYRIIEVDSEPVGSVYLTNVDRGTNSAEIGYYIAVTRYRGRGIGSAALLLMINHAVTALGTRRIDAVVRNDNAASRGLLRKLGFRVILRKSQSADMIYLSLASDEWRRMHATVLADLAAKEVAVSI